MDILTHFIKEYQNALNAVESTSADVDVDLNENLAIHSQNLASSTDASNANDEVKHIVQNATFGDIKQVYAILEQNHLINSDVKDILQSLNQQMEKPMKIAVIGQFSSGKSTFLNALLAREVLPSGITPITAKICEILYGAHYELEVHYKNGLKTRQSLGFLLESKSNENITSYKLYAPLTLLKTMSFLDTPGFNSQRDADTQTTKDVLENVDGILWITLIDNVGKQSERAILSSFMKRYASKSLCVLNQKDRLKDKDVELSLAYAKKAFDGFFEDIIAISAKTALESFSAKGEEGTKKWADSNIQSVLTFLQDYVSPLSMEAKTHSLSLHLRHLLIIFMRHIRALNAHNSRLIAMLESMPQDIERLYENSAFSKQFSSLYEALERQLSALAQHIYHSISKQKALFVAQKRKLGIQQTYTYHKDIAMIPTQMVNLSLNKSDCEIFKEFQKLGVMLAQNATLFSDFIYECISAWEASIKQWYQHYEANKNVRLDSLKQRLQMPSSMGKDSQESNDLTSVGFVANTLKAYNKALYSFEMQTREELLIAQNMIVSRYPVAISLCVAKINNDIQEALNKHRENEQLPLFNPTLEHIRDALNEGFGFSHLQNLLLTRPLKTQILYEMKKAISDISGANILSLQTDISSQNAILKDIKQCLKHIKKQQ